ncbi:MAG: 3-deoxy-manno-octulosonate cytidylyltransferase [Nitrospirota bacterium]
MVKKPRVVVVIPARYKSTRLPGKPLAEICGKPLIFWVYTQAKKIKNIDDIFVATDDECIKKTVENFNGKAILTSDKHQTGTDRIAEAVQRINADIIVNIQGDEPLFDPNSVEKLVDTLISDRKKEISMVTLMTKIKDANQYNNINTVKVVYDNSGFALYFSRALIPYPQEKNNYAVYKHVGIYGFRKDFLMHYSKMQQTPLEKIESLEQLRILENGFKIKLIETDCEPISIDTPVDLELIKKHFNRKQD